MSGAFETFLALPEQDKRDLFDAVADRLDTLPSYAEKDFWVCLVLDALYNRLPEGHPRLLFKGGTSLSKAFNLIQRFSEDIDLVVSRGDLGFEGQRDPTIASTLSSRKRSALFKQLTEACSHYVLGDMSAALAKLMNQVGDECRVGPDEGDIDQQTILVEHPTLYPPADVTYVAPRIRIEAGARSALDPSLTCTVTPYVAHELTDWSFNVKGVRAIAPERTLWEKLLILHGLHCGYRDARRAPADRNRISRHYVRRRDDCVNRDEKGCFARSRPAGCRPEPQSDCLPASMETVRGGRPRIGETGSAARASQTDRAGLHSHAGHDPRRAPTFRVGPGTTHTCRGRD